MKTKRSGHAIATGVIGLIVALLSIGLLAQAPSSGGGSKGAGKSKPGAHKKAVHRTGPAEVDCTADPSPGSPDPHGNSPWQEVDCQRVKQYCPKQNDPPAHPVFDVDYFLKNNVDDPVCIRANGQDDVTWSSQSHNLKVVRFSRKDDDAKHGHPFQTVPIGDGTANTISSGALQSNTFPDLKKKYKCYVFDTVLSVDPGAHQKCYDPHIYTSCDPDCTLNP